MKTLENNSINNSIQKLNLNPSKEKEIFESLVPELSEIRYKEMMTLFNKKPYEEGIVRTENHVRTYIYFQDFLRISDQEIEHLLTTLEHEYPHLKGSIYLRVYKDKKFISLEPLFPNFLEKEVAKELADMMKKHLKKKNK